MQKSVSNHKEKWKVAFVAITAITSIDVWSCKLIPDIFVRSLEAFLFVCLIVITLFNSSVLQKKLQYKKNVWLFIAIPLLSIFGAQIFHEQAFGLSLLMLRILVYWLLYFVLHIFDLSVERVIQVVLFVGFMWGFITLVQQFTYPIYFFFNRQDSETGTYQIYRAGVYRFMIYGFSYGVFLLLYAYYQYINKGKFLYLFLTLAGVVFIYVYGLRQLIVVSGICMFLTLFLTKGKPQRTAFAFAAVAVAFISLTAEYFINQYVELTKGQFEYEDAREISSRFFLLEYWPHWVAVIIGNGPPHELSAYGKEMIAYNQLHLYRVDVGIIGAFNAFGILHVLNILWVNLKSLRARLYTRENKYLLLMILFITISLLLGEQYASKVGIPFYCFIFYLIDKTNPANSQTFREKELKPNTIRQKVKVF